MTAGGANPVDAFDDLRDASRERLLAEIGTLKHQYDITGIPKLLEELHAQIHDGNLQIAKLETQTANLEMSLLHSRDFARGAAAEVGELRANLAAAERKAHQARQQLKRTLETRTWKIGNMMLLPVRIARRIVRLF
jgi:chromosome segregation ATPase